MGDFIIGLLLGIGAGFVGGTAFWKLFYPRWFKKEG